VVFGSLLALTATATIAWQLGRSAEPRAHEGREAETAKPDKHAGQAAEPLPKVPMDETLRSIVQKAQAAGWTVKAAPSQFPSGQVIVGSVGLMRRDKWVTITALQFAAVDDAETYERAVRNYPNSVVSRSGALVYLAASSTPESGKELLAIVTR